MENFDMLNLKNLKDKTFHFIGIGGISMSALAQILMKNGYKVQGSDVAENSETIKLKKKGVKVFGCHKANNLRGVKVVVYTSAIHDGNEELEYAKSHGLLIIKRAELLGAIARQYMTVIAVAGSHGKTTATGMISEVFMQAGLKPTFLVGGALNSVHSNFAIGNKKFFIAEACEYMDNYLYIKPDISVILNVDSDHLDYFKDLEGVKRSFGKFKANTKKDGISVLCLDDENSKELIDKEDSVTFGFSKKADLHAVNIKEYKPCHYSFDAVFMKCKLGNIKLNIVGRHNILNALCAVMVGLACAIDFCDIKLAIENFSGVERRCEKLCDLNKAEVYHDYAHHPAQIEKMMKVAKDLTAKSHGKIITVFEPHTFSRTKFLLDEFAKSFEGSDRLILAPVYSAREDESEGLNSKQLAKACKSHVQDVCVIDTFDEIYDEIVSTIKPNDVVMILGAGTIEHLASKFKK